MAGICCGLVGENEPSPVEPTSRSSRRRKLNRLPAIKLVTDATLAQPVDNRGKRQKLDHPSPPVSEHRHTEEVESSVKIQDVKMPSDLISAVARQQNKPLLDEPKFGLISVCGRRRDMEDAVSFHPSFCTKDFRNLHFFGVFDGHGCSHVAMRCKERLHKILKEEIEDSSAEWREMMEKCFYRMDREVARGGRNAGCDWSSISCRCELRSPQCDAVGSTAVVAVVSPEKIIISSCGDSRAVLCRSGVAVPLSSDHKPDRRDELLRIQKAGGKVIYWDGPRVLGVLAMSRAIGDDYLKPFVIPDPEVTITDRTDEDECLILASDGLWDVVTNETACQVARMCLGAAEEAGAATLDGRSNPCSDAALLLTKLALARHSTDNVSVVVVDMRRSRRL